MPFTGNPSPSKLEEELAALKHQVVLAYIVMAYIVMAYIVMAYIVMAGDVRTTLACARMQDRVSRWLVSARKSVNPQAPDLINDLDIDRLEFPAPPPHLIRDFVLRLEFHACAD